MAQSTPSAVAAPEGVAWFPCQVWVAWPNGTQQLCTLESYDSEQGRFYGQTYYGVVTPPGWRKSLKVPVGWLGDTVMV